MTKKIKALINVLQARCPEHVGIVMPPPTELKGDTDTESGQYRCLLEHWGHNNQTGAG